MATEEFSPAPEVKELAETLIPQYHQHIKDFSVRIEYHFTSKIPKKGGKEVWGYIRKITGLNAYLSKSNPEAEPYFVMIISRPIWEIMKEKSKKALVDHELCHVGAKLSEKEEDVVKLLLNPHDSEEFQCITRRYGNWAEEVFDKINEQSEKDVEEDAAESPLLEGV